MTKRELVVMYRKRYPSFTLQEIGDKVHLTGERVRQILKSENLTTMGYFPRKADRPPTENLYKFNHWIAAGTAPMNVRIKR